MTIVVRASMEWERVGQKADRHTAVKNECEMLPLLTLSIRQALSSPLYNETPRRYLAILSRDSDSGMQLSQVGLLEFDSEMVICMQAC